MMRVWVDITNSPHVLVLRPIIERLRAAGHEVDVTSREYAQTVQLLELHGIEHTPIGRHAGASAVRKAAALAGRTAAMVRFGRGRGFDLALAHGSNDLAIAARLLRIPEVNMHDYEYAVMQHRIGCRLARRVIFPELVPAERLRRFGVGPGKLRQYPGLKEEYYLADFEPDAAVPAALGIDLERVVVTLRFPPDVSLYHRRSNELFPEVLRRLGTDPSVHAVVLPRTDEQRALAAERGLGSLIVPERAVDAQSLVAQSDLVISAGGTMNREAVALGVPVYTTYGGRMGAVDEALIRSGKLRPLAGPEAIELRKRERDGERTRRDPQLLVDLILGTIGGA
jgi:uncharacterized protein